MKDSMGMLVINSQYHFLCGKGFSQLKEMLYVICLKIYTHVDKGRS